MAFDYFTIQALACELRCRLSGAVIDRAYARNNELAFSGAGADRWFFAVGGREGVMCLRPGPWPGNWSAGSGPEKYLVKARIVEVSADRKERIIRIRLERRDRQDRASFGVLICQLIPNKIQFSLIREESREILGHWSGAKRPSSIGAIYNEPEPAGRLLPGIDPQSAWSEQVLQGGELGKIARRWLCGADANIARELSYRANVVGGEQPDMAMWAIAVDAYRAAPIAQAYLWEEQGETCYSAFEPRRLQGESRMVAEVSQAIWSAYEAEREKRKNQRKVQQVKSRLQQALKKGRRRLGAMQKELTEAENADDCEKMGNTLLANITGLSAGISQVKLVDVFDPDGRATLNIKLDPNRSPAENAARYLKAVKKYRRRRQVVPPRLRELANQCDKWEQWLIAVEEGAWQDDDALRNWLEDKVKRSEKKVKEGPSAHPRRYLTSTGWSVWSGRNNKENDILSHKMSAQNDIWFHAHGYPGSHVVLRREGRKEEPDKQTLEEAAGLAAFWSKGKTAKKVSVVYTLVKHVTKPRGGAPGQALLRREKTIVVAPSLIKEESDA